MLEQFLVITPGTSTGTTALLVAAMLFVSASFRVLFVRVLDRPIVRDVIERSQTVASRAFGGLLILVGVRVALAER